MTSSQQQTTKERYTVLTCEHCGRRFRRGEHFICAGSVVSGK